MIRGLIVHASKYSLGNLLVTLAGFISFPLFTRIFAVDEYGLMSLVATTLSLAVGLGKLGVQHSIVRFYAETKSGTREVSLRQYHATVIGGMAMLGLCATAIWSLVVAVVPDWAWHDARIVPLLRVASVLVLLRIFESALVNLLRADQRSGLYSAYMVVRKYLGILVIASTVLYLVHGVYGFYLGSIVGELAMVVALCWFTVRKHPFSPRDFQPDLFKSMLQFGIPMIGYELGAVVLSIGDRYVLQAIAGPAQLGYYSAAYNMCEYVQTILVMSIGQAVVPIYLRIWQEKGERETIRFISRVQHFYLMLAAFVVASMAALGGNFLAVLASAKYLPGAPVIPWVMAGMVLDGCIPFVAAGIFLRKQTHVMMLLMLMSASVNIGLNFLLVPSQGIVGSAIATTVSYLLLAGSAMTIGRRGLAVPFPVGTVLKFCAVGAASYLLMDIVSYPWHRVVELLLKGGAGVLAFGMLVLLCDQPARGVVRIAWARAPRVMRA